MKNNHISKEEIVMNKFLEWTKKPITWGAYLKLSGVCGVLGALLYTISYVLIFRRDIVKKVRNIWKEIC